MARREREADDEKVVFFRHLAACRTGFATASSMPIRRGGERDDDGTVGDGRVGGDAASDPLLPLGKRSVMQRTLSR
jgi:hypothetical protein